MFSTGRNSASVSSLACPALFSAYQCNSNRMIAEVYLLPRRTILNIMNIGMRHRFILD